MQAYLIDATTRTITGIEYAGDMSEWSGLLDCDRPHDSPNWHVFDWGDQIVGTDPGEGWLRGTAEASYFRIRSGTSSVHEGSDLFVHKGLLVGMQTERGDFLDPVVGANWLHGRIEWYDRKPD